MGLMKTGLRLPLTKLSDQYHKLVRDAMRQAGVQL
jgi:4-hydroxy-tetrahydrodipicolinate synthase